MTGITSLTLGRVRAAYAAHGLKGVLEGIGRRLRTPRARSFSRLRSLVVDRVGIEIGGPSSLFARGGLLPLYPLVRRLDQCNFSGKTMWDALGTAASSSVGKIPGVRLISEGSNLNRVDANAYDVVLSSHMLEHTANPLRALAEWLRVLRPGGLLVLVVPHGDGTFDHRRPFTTLAHLRDDLQRGTGEDDLSHLDEILSLHDLSRDPGLADMDELRERGRRNEELRSLHHHVFATRLAVAAVKESGFVPLVVEPLLPYHIMLGAGKPPQPSPIPDELLGHVLAASPFPSGRGAGAVFQLP